MTLMMTSLFFDNITRAAAMLVKIPEGESKQTGFASRTGESECRVFSAITISELTYNRLAVRLACTVMHR
jgi:hypothetical protein